MSGGVGTELSRILAGPPFWIQKTAGCHCQADADALDANGVEWCQSNIDAIVGWLGKSAAERGIPFVPAVGRLIVRQAIRNARRAAAAN